MPKACPYVLHPFLPLQKKDKGKPDWGFPLMDNLMCGDYWRIWLMSWVTSLTLISPSPLMSHTSSV